MGCMASRALTYPGDVWEECSIGKLSLDCGKCGMHVSKFCWGTFWHCEFCCLMPMITVLCLDRVTVLCVSGMRQQGESESELVEGRSL